MTINETTSRKFGIEFEALGLTVNAAAEVLRNQNIPLQVVGYSNTSANQQGQWKVCRDGSIPTGFEAATPPSTSFNHVMIACAALTGSGAYVTRSCGTHVHVDAHDIDLNALKRLCKIWIRIEESMEELVSRSRRGHSSYCHSNRFQFSSAAVAFADIDLAVNRTVLCRKMQNSRYVKLNLETLRKHGTIEFRMHQGTLNADKIERWTRLCIRIVNLAVTDQFDLTNSTRLNLLPMLKEIFKVRNWSVVTGGSEMINASAASAPTFMPRAGTKRRALWELFDANHYMTRKDAAALAELEGFKRKYATDQHWHWRRARSFNTETTSAMTAQVHTDNVCEMRDSISYFSERAQDLAS